VIADQGGTSNPTTIGRSSLQKGKEITMKESTQTANTFVRGARRVLPHFDWRASPEVTPAGDVGPDRAGRPEVLGLNHVGLAARDPARLAEFYRDVVGLEIVGGSPATNEFGATAFLKGRASQEAHQLVLFASPQFRHTAFRVETLNDLRRFHRLIRDRGVPIEASFNHGASLAFYFRDPEENLIEIYWDTGARNHQPYGDPLDLTRP
jgi:catechol 2,3-dioxygenase-like lactoylglutathione lyase family enzyme